jgi:ParB-like chromosome segregation protein Spo0J
MTSAVAGTPDFKIDAEFATLIRPCTGDEDEGLRASIAAHGVREALVIWREERILLDGHHRFAICRALGLPFPTVDYSFIDRDAARRWVIGNQLGRRNLTEAERRFLRGQLLHAEKKDPAATLRKGDTAPLPQPEGTGETAERLAKREGVSRATIERDAQFARHVDEIAAKIGTEAKDAILAGTLKLSRKELATAAATGVLPARQNQTAANEPKRRTRPKRSYVDRINELGHQLASAIGSYRKAGFDVADLGTCFGLTCVRTELEELDANPPRTERA